MEAERNTLLCGRLTLWQPARGHGYRFNLDPVLLAGFTQPAEHVLDLGAGCGIAGLLLLAAGKAKRVTAVEVQAGLAELAQRNVVENGYKGQCEVVHADLRSLDQVEADAVVFNPPYFRAHQGRPCSDRSRDMARHERCGTLADFVHGGRRSMAPGAGRLSAIVRVDRGQDLQDLLTGSGALITRLRQVVPRVGRQPTGLLVEARWPSSMAAVAGLGLEPPLVVHGQEGRAFTAEVASYLGEASAA